MDTCLKATDLTSNALAQIESTIYSVAPAQGKMVWLRMLFNVAF